MCSTVKTPTPQQPKEKPPVYMRNRYLDGLGIGAESSGRNSLRIDPGTPAATRPTLAATPLVRATNPSLGIGSASPAPLYGRRATNMGILS